MALFTDLASLSQTASSNAADGSVDAPSTLDNQLNLLASFCAQLRDGNFSPADEATFRAAIGAYALTSGTAQTTTSLTVRDFTGIPSWVKRITVLFGGVSTSGSSNLLVQLGDSGGFETTGYAGAGSIVDNSTRTVTNYTTGFGLPGANPGNSVSGILTLALLGDTVWIANGGFSLSTSATRIETGGGKTLSGVLDRIRITTLSGSDTFDDGAINILYE